MAFADGGPRALLVDLAASFRGGASDYAEAYDRWGNAADARLNGQFATILVDPKTNRIRLSRSPIAAPPLYWCHTPEGFAAATTPEALFATGLVERKVDRTKLADALYLNYAEGERGWFEGIHRLPTGAIAWADRDGVRVDRWYDPAALPEIRLESDEAYVEAADALFREAAEDSLTGFDKPAVSLSGGYDSQAVAAYALEARPDRRLISYTSIPGPGHADPSWARGHFGDERAHVEAFAAMHPRLDPRWIEAPKAGLDHLLREMIELSGQPPRNAVNLYWLHEMRRAAVDEGCDVILTGSLGNLALSFNGAGLLRHYASTGRHRDLLREVWHGRPKGRVLHRAARAASWYLPGPMRSAFERWRDGDPDDPLETWSPLRREAAEAYDVAARAEEMGFDAAFRDPFASPAAYRAALLGNAMNEAGDIQWAMERLHGIPMRDPTAYRPFLEFCLSIPPEQFLNRGRDRWLARRMLKGKVPDMVLDERRRGRQGADWARRLRRDRERFLEELDWLRTDPDVAELIDIDRLETALKDMPEDDADLSKRHMQTLKLALPRALAAARFVRMAAGKNDV